MNEVVILYPTEIIHAEINRAIGCYNIVQIVLHYTTNYRLIRLIESFHHMSRIREQCEEMLCRKFKCSRAVLLCSPHIHAERDQFVYILHHMGIRNCWNYMIQNHPDLRHATTVQIYGESRTLKLGRYNQIVLKRFHTKYGS